MRAADPRDVFVLGTSQLGGLFRPVSDALATETLEAAWESGVRHFDTAPHYGAGQSERRVGAFLQQFDPDEYTVSTKVGRRLRPTTADVEGVEGFFGADRNERVLDYSGAGVTACLEESLERMGLPRVDTVYVHDPDQGPEGTLEQAIAEAVPALVELRDRGVVSHVGAGMNDAETLERIVRETEADRVMVAGRYTLLDRVAEHGLLDVCTARGVEVVAAGVFNSGLLADPRPGATYDYGEASVEVVAHVRLLQRTCAQAGVSLRSAALQFPLRHPAVVAVAVGCRGQDQVLDNLARLLDPLPDDLWCRLDPIPSTEGAR